MNALCKRCQGHIHTLADEDLNDWYIDLGTDLFDDEQQDQPSEEGDLMATEPSKNPSSLTGSKKSSLGTSMSILPPYKRQASSQQLTDTNSTPDTM